MMSLPNWHPFLVHFPVALFTTAWVCDAVLLICWRRGWLDRAIVLMFVIAAAAAGAAALSGKLAADGMIEELPADVNEAVATHGDWAFFAVVALFVVAALRFDALWRDRDQTGPTVHRTRLLAFVLASVALAALVVTAARGGELVYRYGVAVQDREIIPPRR